MRKPTDKKAVRVNLDNETVDMLSIIAEETDSSKSRVVREAIRNAYKELKGELPVNTLNEIV